MLGEPQRSPYDLEFMLLGFHVRVSWLFWAISAALGYNWAKSLDDLYSALKYSTPGVFGLLAIWVAVSFVSILVHELGHTFAMRIFGIPSHIVLHGMGGLAIPETAGGSSRRGRLSHWQSITISAAGPAVQLVLGLAAVAIAFATNHPLGLLGDVLSWLGFELPKMYLFENAMLTALLDSFLFTSIFWPVLNLIPILPLDGGQIARDLFGWFNKDEGVYEATVLSLICCGGLGFYCFKLDQPMLAMFMLYLGMMNVQTLQNRVY